MTVDAHDMGLLARFWSEAIGWPIAYESDEEWCLEAPGIEDRSAAEISFARVPDEKVVKNRLHFDLRPLEQEAEVERLIGLGATRVDVGQGDVTWVVMADPEGNEFCVLRALGPDEH